MVQLVSVTCPLPLVVPEVGSTDPPPPTVMVKAWPVTRLPNASFTVYVGLVATLVPTRALWPPFVTVTLLAAAGFTVTVVPVDVNALMLLMKANTLGLPDVVVENAPNDWPLTLLRPGSVMMVLAPVLLLIQIVSASPDTGFENWSSKVIVTFDLLEPELAVMGLVATMVDVLALTVACTTVTPGVPVMPPVTEIVFPS